MTLAIISHPDCNAHDMGANHPECAARIESIERYLAKSPISDDIRRIKAKALDKSLLSLAHDTDYIQRVFELSPQMGMVELDADTKMNPATLSAALLAAGATTQAVDLILTGEITCAFCLTRPPGHHAERAKAMGFCIFNHLAIAALYAQGHHSLKRIAIVDFDVHHGNGTQEIVRDKAGILFCSSFQYPLYPMSGLEPHPPHIINSPLSANSGSAEFRAIIQQDWLPALHQFKPELILISAGFDAHQDDLISQINLHEEDYRWVTEQLKDIAEKYAQGRIISQLEGGYSLDALGKSVVAHLAGLI